MGDDSWKYDRGRYAGQENPDAVYDWTRYYQNQAGPTSNSIPGIPRKPGSGHAIAEAVGSRVPDIYSEATHPGTSAADRLYEMSLEDFLSDWDKDQAKLQKKLNSAGSGAGTAQAEYDKAMAALTSNLAIYERLMNASAGDTSDDIKSLIDEAAQSEELAALEEASGYGMEYVNRGDIGTGIAGMDINPQGNYVSGDAAALLKLSAAESDLNIEDLQARHEIGNEYINELAGLTGMAAEMRIGEAARVRDLEAQQRQERLQKALAAAAAARRRAQEALDEFGSREEAAAAYKLAYDRDQEATGLKEQSKFDKEMDRFFRDLDSPVMNSDPVLMEALMDFQNNVETRAVMDELINRGAMNPTTLNFSDDQLTKWFQTNRPS